MKSRTTIEFRKLFADLPEQVKEQVRASYHQFKANPSHPSLRFKKVHPELPIYSAQSEQKPSSSWSVGWRHCNLVLGWFTRKIRQVSGAIVAVSEARQYQLEKCI